jgi:hypothetical protein
VLDGPRVWARATAAGDNVLLRFDGRWRRVPGVEDPVQLVPAAVGPPYVLRRGTPWRLGRLRGPEASVPLGERDAVADVDVRGGLAVISTVDRVLAGRIDC